MALLKKAEEQGNLLRGIVNWSGVAWKAQNNPFDNSFSNIFFISTLKKKQFLQAMLAIHGFQSENKFGKNYKNPAISNHLVCL